MAELRIKEAYEAGISLQRGEVPETLGGKLALTPIQAKKPPKLRTFWRLVLAYTRVFLVKFFGV